MKQNSIKPAAGSKKTRKRVGRGGQYRVYAGRGMNGQNSRSGGGVRPGFEGGQTPLLQRMPKMKGFKNINKVNYFPLNVATIEALGMKKVDSAALVEAGLIKAGTPVKLLGNGEISAKVEVTVDKASASAIEKVEKAGGKVTVLTAKTEQADA